jgi:hypothetical protein
MPFSALYAIFRAPRRDGGKPPAKQACSIRKPCVKANQPNVNRLAAPVQRVAGGYAERKKNAQFK